MGKFLVSSFKHSHGGKRRENKTKQKIQTRCVVFFFTDFSGCGGFQRRFLLGGGEDLTEEKWGVFGVAASTNFSIPWRAGIGLIRFYARLSF